MGLPLGERCSFSYPVGNNVTVAFRSDEFKGSTSQKSSVFRQRGTFFRGRAGQGQLKGGKRGREGGAERWFLLIVERRVGAK